MYLYTAGTHAKCSPDIKDSVKIAVLLLVFPQLSNSDFEQTRPYID